MSYEFVLKSKPFSINASYYSDARTKTAEVRQWAANIFHQLGRPEHQAVFEAARTEFNEDIHAIEVSIIAYYPTSIFITKEGKLSSRTIDVTNFEKLLVDLFFDKQYFAKPSPYGCKNLNLNDKHIISMTSKKLPHNDEEHILHFKLDFVPRPF